jgi:hypothetical protein
VYKKQKRVAKKEDVQGFLNDFHVKLSIYDILFRDNRPKNTNTLLALEISPNKRKEIIAKLKLEDYCEGPMDDKLYGIASMWVFGTTLSGKEIFIKISMGPYQQPVICISCVHFLVRLYFRRDYF